MFNQDLDALSDRYLDYDLRKADTLDADELKFGLTEDEYEDHKVFLHLCLQGTDVPKYYFIDDEIVTIDKLGIEFSHFGCLKDKDKDPFKNSLHSDFDEDLFDFDFDLDFDFDCFTDPDFEEKYGEPVAYYQYDGEIISEYDLRNILFDLHKSWESIA